MVALAEPASCGVAVLPSKGFAFELEGQAIVPMQWLRQEAENFCKDHSVGLASCDATNFHLPLCFLKTSR